MRVVIVSAEPVVHQRGQVVVICRGQATIAPGKVMSVGIPTTLLPDFLARRQTGLLAAAVGFVL